MTSPFSPPAAPPGSTAPSPCPASATLIAFARGLLAPEQVLVVNQHLESCPRCETTLLTLRDDSDHLITFLRQARVPQPQPPDPVCQRLLSRAAALGAPPGATAITALRCPRELGQYLVVRPLHSGGMGLVYEAYHIKLERKVALKTLRPDRVGDASLRARFEREMAAAGRLNHPGIVRALDAGECQGIHFLVMDFIEGLNLSELVRLLGPLPQADACEIVRQAALALECVHQHGLVHRDVKPSNLMLTPTGEVKLLDLGLALLNHPEWHGDGLSGPGQQMGTLDYMAPEQARDAHEVNSQADVYSLGCTFYRLLTGAPPFSGPAYSTERAKLDAHQFDTPAPLREQRPDLPADLQSVLDRMLAKEAGDRFANPAQVALALTALTSEHDLPRLLSQATTQLAQVVAPAALSPASPVTTSHKRAAPPADASPLEQSSAVPSRSRRRWLLVAVVALLVPLLGLAVLPWLAPPIEPATTKPGPVVPGVAKPFGPSTPGLPWPDDYPAELRRRPWNQPVELVRLAPDRGAQADATGARNRPSVKVPLHAEPLWQPVWGRRLCGPGGFNPMPYELDLVASYEHQNEATLLALDHDLERRWFEFRCLAHWPINNERREPRGVFFGWEAVGENRARAYFVHLDMNPVAVPGPGGGLGGQVLIGPAEVDVNAPLVAPLRPYQGQPPAKIIVLRPAWAFQLTIRAVPDKITIAVNHEEPVEILRPPFDPRGPLGVWAQQGSGRFTETSITALAVRSP